MNPSDARSARRVANAGAVFVAGIGMAMIASQASAALSYFDAFEGLGSTGEWFGRAGLAGMGALMIYFGNAWPMMPTAREPGPGPAAQKAFHRLYGWTVVVAGLFVLAALALPGRPMPAAVAAVSLALVLAVAALIVRLLRATRARSAT